jgi:DNA polymerase-3 subunit epsilon
MMEVGDRDLNRLVVLFLDCQTTGANPKNGSVVEIGWARSHASQGKNTDITRVHAHLLRLPVGQDLPARVQSVTGIRQQDLDAAHEPAEVWNRLLTMAEEIMRLNRLDWCPLIIHFARFETPFLLDLHDRYSQRNAFPFKMICTHIMAKRLFPQLPRRSLRAMAGYFGYSVGESRRCSDHVMATAFLWQSMLGILREKSGITTFAQFHQWLDQPMSADVPERIYPMVDEQRSGLPHKPGVYRMLRSNGDILYIGKAKSLRHRVNSYFRRSSQHPEHILEMLSQAKQLDITETESVLEAVILESDEIKRFSPPYNVALRKNERSVWFCSRDYQEFNTKPDASCRIGPLPSQEPMKRLAAITRLLKTGSEFIWDDESMLKAIGIPEDYAPDKNCMVAGFNMFLMHHREELFRKPTDQVLKLLGRELWLKREAEKEMRDEDTEDFALKSIGLPIWTPESVCRLLESNIVQAAYEMRRARWLVLLSESAFAWEEYSNDEAVRFLIVFEKGQVLYRKKSDGEDVPVPPGHGKMFCERQRSFDLMTLDRMRVVTTEMRKLVSNHRWIKLRLGPHNFLEGDSLQKVFKWV